MPLEMSDAAPLDGVRRTRDGYLVANVRAGRTGIQEYAGAELGEPDRPVVRVYRPEDEVFDGTAMATAAHRPVTVGHPSQAVDANSWRDVAVGMTGGDVVRDGGYLRIPLCLMDSAAIDAVEAGTRQLSWGYTCALDWTAGTAPDGQPYDAVQREIRINHLAVVDAGRAGPECRIGDAARGAGAAASTPTPTNTQGGRAMPDADLRTVVVDGLSIPVTTQGAEVITRLQRQLGDAATAADALRVEHGRAVQALDGQLAAARAEAARSAEAHQGEVAALRATHQQALDAAQGQIAVLQAQTSDAALDARVAARTALIASACRILGDSYDATGRSDLQVRRDVVGKALPTLPIGDDKGEAYVLAAYDAVMASPALSAPALPGRPDPLRVALATGAAPAGTVTDAQPQQLSAWERNRQRLERAHLTAGAKEG